jgi:hypothetical protein
LRDTLATADRERRVAVVDQQHADLAAIVRINRARRIQHGDTVLRCEARAGTDLRLVARWQRDRKASVHQRALPGRKHKRRIFGNRGQEIEPRGIRALICRQRQTFTMRQLPDIDSTVLTTDLLGFSQARLAIAPPMRLGLFAHHRPGVDSDFVSSRASR